MTVISEGISRVRAFALPAGLSCDGHVSQLVCATVVKWHSMYNDMLYQVYVNGKFAGATVEPTQRQIVVPIPLSQKTAVRIEVFAVESRFADIDFSDCFIRQTYAGRVKIEFPRTDNLPLDGNVDYYLGVERMNERQIKIHPESADKSGFGLSCFGFSEFGYDGSAAIGFGKGNFGCGWFGFDADMLSWQSKQLQTGEYKFGVKIIDDCGNETQEIETEQLTVVTPAEPAESLGIKSFDKQSGKLILQIK